MATREDIISTAKTYIDTPYHHQGRVKGVGLDCCGLVICVAKELGLSDYDLDGYSRTGDGVDFVEQFNKTCLPSKDLEPGNIVVIRVGRYPHHCGIVSMLKDHLSLIHAYQSQGSVKEHYLDSSWSDRIVAIYQFPNVGEQWKS